MVILLLFIWVPTVWAFYLLGKHRGFTRHHCSYRYVLPADDRLPRNHVAIVCKGCGEGIPCEITNIHHDITVAGSAHLVGIIDDSDFRMHRLTHEGA